MGRLPWGTAGHYRVESVVWLEFIVIFIVIFLIPRYTMRKQRYSNDKTTIKQQHSTIKKRPALAGRPKGRGVLVAFRISG
ncbi:hypothetical protein IHE26_13290 [Plesiomonas shigelloides]|uniref:hypothetical protein n=1 Tax=Plesiomonas shigelloides TaxID=703 RepID=UPI00177F1799|nr:hypothetical protein [Plesiomonas shigelloides]QOH79349.1 hypothetical protein IHE26_13290 [Plesiomonas shigelloides]